MSNVTTLVPELIKSTLAAAVSEGVKVFEDVSLISTDNGDVISVLKEEGGIRVFITADEEQVRTVTYLMSLAEVSLDKREEFFKALLIEGVSLSLASFGIEEADGEENLILYGSLATSSSEQDLIKEVNTIFSTAESVAVEFLTN